MKTQRWSIMKHLISPNFVQIGKEPGNNLTAWIAIEVDHFGNVSFESKECEIISIDIMVDDGTACLFKKRLKKVARVADDRQY